jgi:hypothetical protein
MNLNPPLIDSRETFAAALRWGFAQAVAQDARTITCVDPDFEHWPLDDETLLQTLAAWLRLPQRRLVLLAATYDQVPRRQPRFTTWRRDWAHAIQPLQAPAELAPGLPTLLLDDRSLCVRLIDVEHWRGRAGLDKRDQLLWQERVDVVLQRSEAAFAVTTLGL